MSKRTDQEKIEMYAQQAYAMKRKVERIVNKYVSPMPFEPDFVIDLFWGCDMSPFGYCAYQEVHDYAHDECIFCNQPQERI